jgi:deoxyribose-phosphate aldolase
VSAAFDLGNKRHQNIAVVPDVRAAYTKAAYKGVTMQGIDRREIEALIPAVDYSDALTITASPAEVKEACESAREYGFRSVAAFPQYVGLVAETLKGSGVRTLLAVAFPCGGVSTHVKCTEAEEGLERGATDLDMVMNISAFKAGEFQRVSEDIKAVMNVAAPYDVPFKVIIEIGALTDREIADASKLVADCGADFIKTCTGFGPGRATVHAIGLIRETTGDRIGIKASGGVASLEDAVAFMRAGADVVALRRMLVDQLEQIGWSS